MYRLDIYCDIRISIPSETATVATIIESHSTTITNMENVFETIKQNTPRMVERFRENAPAQMERVVESIRNHLHAGGPIDFGTHNNHHRDDDTANISRDLEDADLRDHEVAVAVAAAAAARARMEHENHSSRPLRRMVRNFKEKSPEYWDAVQKLWNGEQELHCEECDTQGRWVASGRYNSSLNEEQDEAREQPPSFSPGRSLSVDRVHRVMTALRNSHTPQEAFQNARTAATSTGSNEVPPEYYVNFTDGLSHQTMSSYSVPLHTPKNNTTSGDEYSEIDDGCGQWKQPNTNSRLDKQNDKVVLSAPSLHCEGRRRRSSQCTQVHSSAPYRWGASTGDQEESSDKLSTISGSMEEDSAGTHSTCSDSEHADDIHREDSSYPEENSRHTTSLHSTAKFEWSAMSSNPVQARVQ